ncbi:MAG: polyphenol oxidase family protein [Clostridia bacterium]|nr:polyphenol oxidase family protein [Clostridia bacterium]
MFYTDGILVKSTLLEGDGVFHAFSTRLGGVSTHPDTTSMNVAPGHGDSDETVRENADILVRTASAGRLGVEAALVTSQIHSAKVRVVAEENRGEGFFVHVGEHCDGFVTDRPGVVPIVRTADCVPILLVGRKADGSPVVSSVHAGWRGTVAGIAAEAVRKMTEQGAVIGTVKSAIGPHIGYCCFEVGDDLYEAVRDIRGEDFARRHIRYVGERLHADLTEMNLEILLSAGVLPENVDVSDECTMCLNDKYHSHRKTHGKRGAMGSLVGIL